MPLLRTYHPGDENRLDAPDDAQARWLLDLLGFFDRYHRYEVDGLEHVPSTGPALLVSYHAYTVIDIFLLGRRVYLRDRRVVRGLTDTFMFSLPGIRDVFTTLGVVRGTQDNGLGLLAQGQLACCMPGGGLEWSRPSSQKRQLRWGDHRGYARLAIRAGAPIVPTACPAADDVYYQPLDGWKLGEAVQRLARLPRVIPLPVPIGLLGWPLPVKLRQYVAPPIWPDVPPEAAEDPAAVERLDARVRQVIAELLLRP